MVCQADKSIIVWSIDRVFTGSFPVLALVLAAAPAVAQPRDTDAELESLIPDSAIDNPQAWVEQGAPPTSPEASVNMETPLAEDSGFTLPWPDDNMALPEMVSLEPEPGIDAVFAEQDEEEVRPRRGNRRQQRVEEKLSSQLVLVFPADEEAFPEQDEFIERFESLSEIEDLSGKNEHNLAQLSVRARSDLDLLQRLLRVYGYYDGEVTQQVNGGANGGEDAGNAKKPAVRFSIRPGKRYAFGAIDLGNLAAAGNDAPMLREGFGIKTGDPLYADKIVTERADLDTALGEHGYPFAKIDDPSLIVDHAREEGDLSMPVAPGGKYAFGTITSNLPRFLSAGHLEDIARFNDGEIYKRSRVEDLRRAILSTGLVSSVTVTPRETAPPQGGQPGEVAMDVEMTKAPLRTIAGSLGYGTGEGARAEVSWEHRNLFPPEGMLRLRGIVGTEEQLAGATLRWNNFRKRDQVLTVDLYAHTTSTGALDTRSVVFNAGLERRATFLFQRPLQWGVGVETTVTSERLKEIATAEDERSTYFIAALPMHVLYDASDDLLNPTRGFRAGIRLSPEYSKEKGGGSATYLKTQLDGSYYQPVSDGVVLAGRARLGSIFGADNNDIAPSRRFFSGGGGSVRGYGYQELGPRNAVGNPTGGRSLAEFSLEARVKTGLMDGAVQVVPFLDAGTVHESSTPKFSDMQFGAGLGLRYLTGFGPFRLDVGTPLNRRPGDSRITVYIGLGQAF